MVFAHSVVMLGAVFGDTEVVDKASSIGEATTGFPFSEVEGRISGVLTAGDDASEVVRLLLEAALSPPIWLLLLLLLLVMMGCNGQPGNPDDESRGRRRLRREGRKYSRELGSSLLGHRRRYSTTFFGMFLILAYGEKSVKFCFAMRAKSCSTKEGRVAEVEEAWDDILGIPAGAGPRREAVSRSARRPRRKGTKIRTANKPNTQDQHEKRPTTA